MDIRGGSPTLRSGLWKLLWIVVAAIVVWFFAWLLFFRDTTPKVSPRPGSDASNKSQSASDKNKPQTSSNNPNPGTGSPNELAATGAGNVLIPFAVATVAGTVFYHVRIRRNVLSE